MKKEGVKGTYEVIREDGRVADHLSEGERNFIAFLYFITLYEEANQRRILGRIRL